METLQIEKGKALTAYDKGGAAIKKLLEDLFGKRTFAGNIIERIQSWEDVLEELSTTQAEFDTKCKGLSTDEVAYRQAKMIASALNEGTEMKLADINQYKYFPWFKVNPDTSKSAGFGLSCCGYGLSGTVASRGARLAFKTEQLAIHAGKTFPEVYERFFA